MSDVWCRVSSKTEVAVKALKIQDNLEYAYYATVAPNSITIRTTSELQQACEMIQDEQQHAERVIFYWVVEDIWGYRQQHYRLLYFQLHGWYAY